VCRSARRLEARGPGVGCGCAVDQVDRDLCSLHEEIAKEMVLIRVLQMFLFLAVACV
jgi:hypothetical protein